MTVATEEAVQVVKASDSWYKGGCTGVALDDTVGMKEALQIVVARDDLMVGIKQAVQWKYLMVV